MKETTMCFKQQKATQTVKVMRKTLITILGSTKSTPSNQGMKKRKLNKGKKIATVVGVAPSTNSKYKH